MATNDVELQLPGGTKAQMHGVQAILVVALVAMAAGPTVLLWRALERNQDLAARNGATQERLVRAIEELTWAVRRGCDGRAVPGAQPPP
jgi:hypothetical protein